MMGNLNTMFLDRWRRENPFDPKSEWIPGKYPALRFNDGNHSNYNRIQPSGRTILNTCGRVP